MPATERDNSQEGSVRRREQEFSQLSCATALSYRVDYRDGEQRQTSMKGPIFVPHPQPPGNENIRHIATLYIYLIAPTAALSNSRVESDSFQSHCGYKYVFLPLQAFPGCQRRVLQTAKVTHLLTRSAEAFL